MKTDQAYLEKIGRLIQEARQNRNLTQTELAEKIGTSQSAINRIESGKQNITLEMLARISDELSSEIISVNAQKKTNFRVSGGYELHGEIEIKTSATGFKPVWEAVLTEFIHRHAVGGLKFQLNDMGATPAVVSLRLSQAVAILKDDQHA